MATHSSPPPVVEILTFEGCPHRADAIALVHRVVGSLGVDAEIRIVEVSDSATAERLRFLGSPTIRVDGLDIEQNAASRTDYGLSCRVYATAAGPAGSPDEALLRTALAGAEGREA